MTLREARLAGLLFRLRGLPTRGDASIFQQMLATGFAEVRESDSELVLTAAGQPWRLRGGRAEGSFVRMTVRIAADGAHLTTETTVEPSDAYARRRFLRYWRVIRPFSGLVRRSWLRAAARRARA